MKKEDFKELNEEIDEQINEEVNEENVNEQNEQTDDIIDKKETSNDNDLEQQNKALQDKLIRTLAEFDNFRKRTIKEKATMYDDGVKSAVEKLLPVLDNLERAISSCDDKENPLYKGVEMVLSQLNESFAQLDVKEIDALGFEFDPNLHNAVMHIDDENYGENEVIEVFQKGYICKDRVIRHSMVKVAN